MSNIEFGTYEPEQKSNEYLEAVTDLAEKNDPNAALIVTVPVNDVQKTKFAVQRAANEVGKTARIRHEDRNNVVVSGTDDEGNDVLSGDVRIVFTLTTKHKARRGASTK